MVRMLVAVGSRPRFPDEAFRGPTAPGPHGSRSRGRHGEARGIDRVRATLGALTIDEELAAQAVPDSVGYGRKSFQRGEQPGFFDATAAPAAWSSAGRRIPHARGGRYRLTLRSYFWGPSRGLYHPPLRNCCTREMLGRSGLRKIRFPFDALPVSAILLRDCPRRLIHAA